MKINQNDYYVGAFLSCLIQMQIKPVFFENNDTVNIIKYVRNDKTCLAYFKASLSKKEPQRPKKNKYSRWQVTITKADIERIKKLNRTLTSKQRLLIVILIGDGNLTNTKILVLNYEELNQCIALNNTNRDKTLAIRHLKKGKYLECYSGQHDEKKTIKIIADFEKLL